MGRLIDADALMESLGVKDCTKYGNKNAEQQAHSYDTMMNYEIAMAIEDAPTAYSVEKVIEQLELKSDWMKERTEDGDTIETYTIDFDKAIEIVKGGGIDGKNV